MWIFLRCFGCVVRFPLAEQMKVVGQDTKGMVSVLLEFLRLDFLLVRLREITDGIEQGIKELFESEKYMRYLSVMSRFQDRKSVV